MLLSQKKILPISPIYLIFELKLLLQHFRKQTQAKRLFFMEKYASKLVQKLRKLKQYAAVILFYVEQHKCPTVLIFWSKYLDICNLYWQKQLLSDHNSIGSLLNAKYIRIVNQSSQTHFLNFRSKHLKQIQETYVLEKMYNSLYAIMQQLSCSFIIQATFQCGQRNIQILSYDPTTGLLPRMKE